MRDRVFPARAGMIPVDVHDRAVRQSIPRESGDDPWDEFLLMAALLYSPRERG